MNESLSHVDQSSPHQPLLHGELPLHADFFDDQPLVAALRCLILLDVFFKVISQEDNEESYKLIIVKSS